MPVTDVVFKDNIPVGTTFVNGSVTIDGATYVAGSVTVNGVAQPTYNPQAGFPLPDLADALLLLL